MSTYKCESCSDNVYINKIMSYRELDYTKYLFLCIKCRDSKKFYSKTDCIAELLLDSTDFINIRFLYFENPKNKIRLYSKSDIDIIIKNKHGSHDKFKEFIDSKNSIKQQKIDKINILKNKREEDIIEAFNLNKLEYYNYGDCYSFIHYGNPSIDNIIANEYKKNNIKNKKRIILTNALKNNKLPYNENYKLVKEYIGGSDKYTIEEIIRSVEVEYFFRSETEYLEILKTITNEELAKEEALTRFMKKKTNTNKKAVVNGIKNIIVEFD